MHHAFLASYIYEQAANGLVNAIFIVLFIYFFLILCSICVNLYILVPWLGTLSANFVLGPLLSLVTALVWIDVLL